MTFISTLDWKPVEMKDWDFIDCKVCHEKSMANHRSKKEEHKFVLCDHCTKELEKLRGAVYEKDISL